MVTINDSKKLLLEKINCLEKEINDLETHGVHELHPQAEKGHDRTGRTQREQELERKSIFVKLLQEIAVAANEMSNVRDVFQFALDRICTILGWPVGHVYMVDRDQKDLLTTTNIWNGSRCQGIEKFRQVTEVTNFKKGEGLPGRVLLHGKPAWIIDVQQDANFPRAKEVRNIGVKGAFGFPVLVEKETMAVLEFFSDHPRDPDIDLLDLMKHIGTQLGRVIERDRAAKAIQSQRSFLYHVVDMIPSVVFAKDDCGRFTLANRAFAELYGTTVEKVIGKREKEFQGYFGEKTPFQSHNLDNQELTDQTATSAQEIVDSSGQQRWLHLVKRTILNEIGNNTLLLGVATDITELRSRIQDLQRTQFAVDNAADTMLTLDEKGQILTLNQTACRRLGYTREELLSMNISEIDLTESRSIFRERWKKLKRDKHMGYETVYQTKVGHRFSVEIFSDYIEFEKDKFVYIFARDITERKQVEYALRRSEERFELAVRGSTDGLWDWTSIRDEKVWWSPRFHELLGYENGELPSTYSQFSEMLHEDDRQKMKEVIEAHLDRKEPFDIEYRSRTKSGEFHWFRARGQAVWDEVGSPLRMAGSVQDIHEQKLAKDALHRSEERLALVLEASNDGVWDWNLETGHVYYSARWIHSLGYTSDAVEPKINFWKSLVHPEDRPRVLGELNEHLAGKTDLYEVENRLKTKSGSWRWNLGRGKVVEWNADEKPVRMVGTDSDISTSKEAELALRESEKRYQILAELSPVGIFHADRKGNYLYVNERWSELSGLGLNQALGKGWLMGVHPKDLGRVKGEWNRCIKRADSFYLEYRFKRSGGEIAWLLGNARVIEGEEGQNSGFVGTITDITHRKKFEDEIKNKKEFSELLIQNSVDGIVAFDKQFLCLVCNEAMEKISGMESDQCLGKNILDLFPLLVAKRTKKLISAVFEGKRSILPDHKYKRKNGEYGYFRGYFSPLYDKASKVAGGLAIIHEITSTKLEKEQVKNQNILLEKAVQEKHRELELMMEKLLRQEKLATIGKLSGSIAHELRNPLGAIKQSVFFLNRLMQMETFISSLPKVKQHLALMTEEIDTSGRVISDLLEFTKIKPIELNLVDLHKLVQEAVVRCRIDGRVEISIELGADAVMIKVDYLLMRQVLVNLITNAFQAISGSGRINIQAHYHNPEGSFRIQICDNGCGIGDDLMEKAFEPLFTTKANGTGLGLSICKEIVENHGGNINLYSSTSLGTIVAIDLPNDNLLE